MMGLLGMRLTCICCCSFDTERIWNNMCNSVGRRTNKQYLETLQTACQEMVSLSMWIPSNVIESRKVFEISLYKYYTQDVRYIFALLYIIM